MATAFLSEERGEVMVLRSHVGVERA